MSRGYVNKTPAPLNIVSEVPQVNIEQPSVEEAIPAEQSLPIHVVSDQETIDELNVLEAKIEELKEKIIN